MANTATIPDEDEFEEDEPVLTEEEQEQERLAALSAEDIARAKRQAAAIGNGYKVSEIAEFQAWKDELIEAIEMGVFDGPDIKDIVAACFRRREAVRPAGSTPAAKVPAAVPAAFAGSILGEGDNALKPAPYARLHFEYKGVKYSRDDMKGKYLRTPVGGLGGLPWYYGGVLAKIIAVGPSNLQIELAEDPKLIHPKSTELKKKQAGIGNRLRVTPSMVDHIFG